MLFLAPEYDVLPTQAGLDHLMIFAPHSVTFINQIQLQSIENACGRYKQGSV